MENQIMTVGVIGNGKSTNRYHAPFIRRLGDKIRIKMIYARHPEKRDWDRLEGVIYTDDLQKLLGDPEIQVIIVTTPMSSHYEYAKKVLQAGKNCVVEKPFTSTVKEAEELFALAKEKGLMLQGYQNRRFDSDFLTAKKIADSGVLGSLFEVEMHFDYYRPEVPEKVTEYSKDTSFLYSHACHTLDQVISWMGEPDRVHFDVRQLLGSGRMNDYFDLGSVLRGDENFREVQLFQGEGKAEFCAVRKQRDVCETDERQAGGTSEAVLYAGTWRFRGRTDRRITECLPGMTGTVCSMRRRL